jgi:hypothetical protein
LAHVAVPLSLGGQQLGALIAGQVFSRYPEPLRLQRVAREAGISQQQLWHEAVQQVPCPRATLQLYANLLLSLGKRSWVNAMRHPARKARPNRPAVPLVPRRRQGLCALHGGSSRPRHQLEQRRRAPLRLHGSRNHGPEGVDSLLVTGIGSGSAARAMLEADRSGSVEWEGWRVRKDGTRFLAPACWLRWAKGIAASMEDWFAM